MYAASKSFILQDAYPLSFSVMTPIVRRATLQDLDRLALFIDTSYQFYQRDLDFSLVRQLHDYLRSNESIAVVVNNGRDARMMYMGKRSG